MAIMAHWIAKETKTSMLVLRAVLITFSHMPGSHAGDCLGQSILDLLDHAEMTEKVCVYLYC
jgi:hypothetical protein